MLGMACVLWVQASGQQPRILQSPREAVIEMMTGGDEALRKHLTLEVQQKLNSSSTNPGIAGLLGMATVAAGPNVRTFESGPVLLSINNPQQNEKLEVRIDNDYLHGAADEIELSFHSFREGKEEDLPIGFHIVLGLLQQEGTWRLNAISLSAKIPVGDPRLFDGSLWMPAFPIGQSGSGAASAASRPNAGPQMPPTRAVRQILLAEDIYSRKHPNTGFTCRLADLVNIGKGFDNGEMYSFLDPQFGDGIYNGYRFTVLGCDANPATSFQVTAEPVSGKGKAYCSDAGGALRMADDGRGATCLTSGRTTLN